MTKLLIFDAFTLLICEKKFANYALLRCKTCSLKIWVCKIFDKFHVCSFEEEKNTEGQLASANSSGAFIRCEKLLPECSRVFDCNIFWGKSNDTWYYMEDTHGRSRDFVFFYLFVSQVKSTLHSSIHILRNTNSAQRVPEPDPVTGICFDTRPDPIQF